MDILVIDLTNRCFLRCSNCTRDIMHQTQTQEMTPETFRTALASVRGWWKPGRVIGLIGGEPTLNRHFEEICRIFRDEFNPGALSLGRAPIRDFNRYAYERLFDRTNGKGLWTSFGPKFTDYYEIISDTFSHWNPNDHSTGEGVHQTSLVDAREMCAALGIDWQQWPAYRDACWVQNTWSASITTAGKAYFCERAAQLDTLYNGGKLGWDVAAEPEWWKRTPAQFSAQLSICEMCSMALPGPGQVDKLSRDIIGEAHLERLTQIGSPAVKRGDYEKFDPAVQIERRKVVGKASYVAPSGTRVGRENKHIQGKHVSALVVCVGRSAHLAVTLPRNIDQVDEFIVVTTSEDRRTQEVVQACPAARLILSDRCYDEAHAFNKGRMINDGLRTVVRRDWVILTDADVILNPLTRQWLAEHAINPGVLYGTYRMDVPADKIPSPAEFGAQTQAPGVFNPELELNAEPNGYFQLFNHRALAIRDRIPTIMSEAFCSAGGVDSWFLQQFPKDKCYIVPELTVAHLQHSPWVGKDWNGAAHPGASPWRQFGQLTPRELFKTEEPPPGPLRLRLTDTLYAQTWEGLVGADRALPAEVLRNDGAGGFIFCGRPIGPHHIHLAWWDEKTALHEPAPARDAMSPGEAK